MSAPLTIKESCKLSVNKMSDLSSCLLLFINFLASETTMFFGVSVTIAVAVLFILVPYTAEAMKRSSSASMTSIQCNILDFTTNEDDRK